MLYNQSLHRAVPGALWIAFESDPQEATLRTVRCGTAGEASLRYTPLYSTVSLRASEVSPSLAGLPRTDRSSPTVLHFWELSTINVLGVSHFDNNDDQDFVQDFVDDSILALSNAIVITGR